jgi:hypothetical protein
MLLKIQRATTKPEFIRILFTIIVVMLLLAGISRTVQAQGESPPFPEFEGTIIDDVSTNFTVQGPNRYWHESNTGYQDHLWWTKNNDTGTENVGHWNLGVIEAGKYHLAVYIPVQHATTHQARYVLHHQGNLTEIIVDQGGNQNSWHSLGDYELDGAGSEYLELVDETGEADSQYEIAFDAVGYARVDPGLEQVVADALWDKVKIWLDEQATELKVQLGEWLEKQKGQLLQQLGNSVTSWIDEQCTGLGAAMALPGFALILWKNVEPKDND